MARLVYLLDTNAWGRYLNGRSETLKRNFLSKPPESIALCAPVIQEIQHGYRKRNWSETRIADQEERLSGFERLALDERAARAAGDIWAYLEKLGTRIGGYDIQIAAIGLVNDLIVVTHNVSEFSRVPGLRWEDWEV